MEIENKDSYWSEYNIGFLSYVDWERLGEMIVIKAFIEATMLNNPAVKDWINSIPDEKTKVILGDFFTEADRAATESLEDFNKISYNSSKLNRENRRKLKISNDESRIIQLKPKIGTGKIIL